MFRTNQTKAVEASINNDFRSGVHFHATGTGKSWIGLQLLLEFANRTENKGKAHVLWICEQKSILLEQFDRTTIAKKGFASLFKTFLILNYTVQKPADWVQQVNSAAIWGKPLLILINRAFLTSSLRYEKLRIPLQLLIHDECHSITNTTTQAFYAFIQRAYPELRCIGFSATPQLEIAPYNHVLSQYTIYDGCKDGVIVPPRIVWFKSDVPLSNVAIRRLVRAQLEPLPYKKLLVWCGMIELCRKMAETWSADPLFAGWTIAVDTSEDQNDGYEQFRTCKEKGILFCASKHREGSDIPLLDACLFLDRVEKRNAKTFLQCMGRVLRVDPAGHKQYGLLLDISAKSSIAICDRMNQYLNSDNLQHFPFKYSCETAYESSAVQIHSLHMTTATRAVAVGPVPKLLGSQGLASLFVRTVPNTKAYQTRLEHELGMLREKNLEEYLVRALEILQITQSVPHVTRGSCGSSLVCYLLGITHVDPVRWGIRFARFLNEFRSTLPDIDFDFPHMLRDEVFLQIHMRWPGQVARISNHVHYHPKSALREAVRRAGIRKMIPALQMYDVVRRLPVAKRRFVETESKRLENTFRGYALHCGGIVFYPEGVPSALRLHTKRAPLLAQITLNKHDVAKEKQCKIDILSSRALTQLYEARQFVPIDFEAFLADDATAELFRRGDNIGITLAESPLIRKAFMKLKPESLEEVAICLAIIRPAARDARVAETTADLDAMFVFDDDAIDFVMAALDCSEAEADRYRRGFAKGDKAVIRAFRTQLQARHGVRKPGQAAQTTVLDKLKNLHAYSFCKSHAFSYAQLVWQLAYMKVHAPAAFWHATLKHCQSSYRKWVHLYEAHLAGVIQDETCRPHKSIYAVQKRAKLSPQTALDSLKCLGVWNFNEGFFPDCYLRSVKGTEYVTLRGILANSRVLSYRTKIKKAVLFVGYAPQKYAEVLIQSERLCLTKKVGITAHLKLKEPGVYEATDFTLW